MKLGHETETEAEFLQHEPCPSCGSRDNLGRYSDGHGFCFGCGHYEKGDRDGVQIGVGGGAHDADRRRHGGRMASLLTGAVKALPKRGLTEETCSRWSYRVGTYKGKAAQIADYFTPNGKTVVAQKIRMPGKEFCVVGDIKSAGLFGQQLWRDKGRMVVVTEGEIDAMSVSQIQQHKWPVVSVPNGASGARNAIAKNLEWLLGFEHVVFMFDNDEPGTKAAIECAEVLPPGRAKIATLPLKDANEMLVASRAGEVVDAIWGAKVYRPDGIVTLAEIKDEILRAPETGLSWWSPTLTSLTYGRRLGECVALGAGTGVGKTDFLTQQIRHDVLELNEKVGLFFLEQEPSETVKRIAGKLAAKRFHVPADVAGWTQQELMDTLTTLEGAGKLYLYNHFGSADWDVIQARIRYLARSEGVRLFYLDHLTALAAEEADERCALETIMAQIGKLVKELRVHLTFVSHLATPEGKPHEEGGRVMIRHFKGSRAIGFWSHYMIGLERNQQADDPESQKLTTVRVLKDRYTGQATGKIFYITYDHESGLLSETNGVGFEAENGEPGF